MTHISDRGMRWLVLFATLLILLSGWLFWSRDLDADPPVNFSVLSQALSTDPPLYTYHARNRLLFNEADPLGDNRWILFEKSFSGSVTTFWFRLTGVSIVHGRQVGLALTFASVFFFLLALWRTHRPWVTIVAAVALMANATLMVYGSFPFLEVSLLFFASAAFLIYSIWGDHWWGVALAAAALAVATFAGKIFGLFLLPALIICEFIKAESGNKLRRSMLALAVFGLTALVLVVVLYGSGITDAFGFLREQTYESRPFPEALKSPWVFVASLLAYGFRNDVYVVALDLLGYLFVAAFSVAVLLQAHKYQLRGLSRTTILALSWVIFTWVGLSIPSYSPARYSLSFIPALVILTCAILDRLPSAKIDWPTRFHWRTAILIGIAGWVVTMQIALRLYTGRYFDGLYVKYMLMTLPVAMAVTLAARFGGSRLQFAAKSITLPMIAILLSAGSVAASIGSYSLLSIGYKTYQIRDANHDLERVVGQGAVISGPYAAALTQENNLMSHPHFFGESWSDSTWLVKLPITHLAVDKSNFELAVRQCRSLESAKPITTYWIGGRDVSVFDVSRIFDNPKANAYEKCTYETAIAYFNNFQYDSAFMALGRDPSLIEHSRSAALLYARSLFKFDLDKEAVHNYMVLHNRYPVDFLITREAANAIQQVAEIRQDSALFDYAAGLYEQAIGLSPNDQAALQSLQSQTHEHFRKRHEALLQEQQNQK